MGLPDVNGSCFAGYACGSPKAFEPNVVTGCCDLGPVCVRLAFCAWLSAVDQIFFCRAMALLQCAFWVYVVFGGVTQIVATGLMIHLFSLRNFAVGTTLVKTEAIQVALIGALFFHQSISHAGWFGVVVSVIGVLLLSNIRVVFNVSREPGFFFNTSALIGLLSGCLFALTSLSFHLPREPTL